MILEVGGLGKWCPRGGESLIFSMVFYDSLIIHQLGFLGVITRYPTWNFMKLIHLIPKNDGPKWTCIPPALQLQRSRYLKLHVRASFIAITARRMGIPRNGGDFGRDFFQQNALIIPWNWQWVYPWKLMVGRWKFLFGMVYVQGLCQFQGGSFCSCTWICSWVIFFRILPRYSSPCFTTIWENMFYFVPSILSKSKCILKSYTKYLPYKEPTAIPFRRVAFCESMIVQPTSTVGEVSPRDNRTLSTKKTISTPRRP